jgi:DNA-binding NarL/FixJ family response regulator
MKLLSIALLLGDAKVARSVAASLRHHFHAIHAVGSLEELRDSIVKHRVEVAIVDIEMASLSEIEQLHREFTGTCIVCTHRLADDQMWTAALNAGAADVCPSFDTGSIVTAALRGSPSASRSAAA